jgi:ceramide glucosyltransferase
MHLLAVLFGVLAAAGLVYQATAAWAVRRFMASAPPVPPSRPPVTVLKPLCGADPGLEAHLISLLRQGYPELQVICGVDSEEDTAVPVVRRVMAQFPAVDISLVVDPTRHGSNLKIGNLMNMLPAAKHELLVIADSDVAAHDGYLDEAVAPFADPACGLVTFLYLGRPLPNLASRLGAAGINHGFLPSALVAPLVGRDDGCFGATMAMPKRLLAEIGGLDRVRDVLADDWALGAAVRAAGRKVVLAARPVDMTVNEPDLATLFSHEIRWGRTIAAIDRLSYIASIITLPAPLALLALLLGGWGWLPLLAAAVLARVGVVRSEEQALGLPSLAVADLLLRDLLSFVVLLTASCGRTVLWRGRRFRVERDGRLTLLEGTYR